jgi:hypothetical protein
MNTQEQRILLERVVEEAKASSRNRLQPMKAIVVEIGAGLYDGMVRVRRHPHEPTDVGRPFYYVVGAVPPVDAEVWCHANFATGFVYGDFISDAVATAEEKGLMDAPDKEKLDGVEDNANKGAKTWQNHASTEVTSRETMQVGRPYSPLDDSVGGRTQLVFNRADILSGQHATAADAGFMPPSDKQKVDSVETGAQVNPTNQETIDAVKALDGPGSLLNSDLLDGLHGADLAPAAHVGATGGAHGAATTSVNGFQSASDKSKINGIEAGATAGLAGPEFVLGDQLLIAEGHHEWIHGFGSVPRYVFCQYRDAASGFWVPVNGGIWPGSGAHFTFSCTTERFFIDNHLAFSVVYRIRAWE